MQIVCGIFSSTEERTKRANLELRWSLVQNSQFWRQAVCYVDPDCEADVEPYKTLFQEVVIDHEMPESVRTHKLWDCKARWAKKAVERFGEILFCDFDIYVFKLPDATLQASLRGGMMPRFLDIPAYTRPDKIVGCGCTYYNADCDWDTFLALTYTKWHCDERAWTEALQMTHIKLANEHWHMNPYIVDWDWAHRHPEQCHNIYILHGISSEDNGREKMLKMGYDIQRLHVFEDLKRIDRKLALLTASFPRRMMIYGKDFLRPLAQKIRRLRRIFD